MIFLALILNVYYCVGLSLTYNDVGSGKQSIRLVVPADILISLQVTALVLSALRDSME